MKKIGLIVNPIAGMGGRVGLKGTDGLAALQEALERGAVPEAATKAARALEKLLPLRDELVVVTCGGEMGENVARRLGFRTEVVYVPQAGRATAHGTSASGGLPATSGADTQAAARTMAAAGVALLLFAGGDGTARDICAAVDGEQVVLGIPAGVKIHSPVYANSPGQAGELVRRYLTEGPLPVAEREVVDIDEDAVRHDELRTALFGYLKVPLDETLLQNPKAPTPESELASQHGIAQDIVETMEPGVCYIIGPGTTTRAIMQALDLPCTLLGVDVVMDGQVLALDASERELLQYIEKYPCKLIVTPVGGQGYLLGRGNQQISSAVVKRIGKDNLIVVATPGKLAELGDRPLLVDTGDPEADSMLTGWHRIKIGYWRERAHRIAAG
ncbi:MAG: hypothetical protein BAA04_13305 [Firmicutes bacterium ZCTH02-B6]|nr:MAG: hypothetical protein BAA04_13305 [Firmicutes bacterium ZCTH02-B6]